MSLSMAPTHAPGHWSAHLCAAAFALGMAGCASAPAAPPAPPAVPYQQKAAWILQLEDQRVLQLAEAPPPAAVPAKGRRPPAPPPKPDSSPNLAVMVKDADGRVRRRAAIAVGRVGLKEGVPLLTPLLADADSHIRQAAAFSLGLIGDQSASGALLPLLSDPDPVVRGRAADALGLMGASESAPAIGKMVGEYARSAAVAALATDDDRWPAAPEAEAFKLGLFSLARLRAYEPLAAAVLDNGRPVVTWWPVAYALQRTGDARAAPALRELIAVKGRYAPAFAARGLGEFKDPAAADVLLPVLDSSQPREVVAAAIRAAAQLRVTQAAGRLAKILTDENVDANLRLESVTALGALQAADQLAIIQDLITSDWPALRAAALRAAAAIDVEHFTLILSGLEPDRHWLVRAALIDVLATLPATVALERVTAALKDEDRRVVPSALRALVRLRAPDVAAVVVAHLKEADYVIRETAATLLKDLKPEGGLAALREAYEAGQGDAAYGARAAAIEAMAAYGAEALDSVRAGLADKDWAVRVRALDVLAKLDPPADHRLAIRPAPGTPISPYDDPQLIAPAYSPHVFIETARGTIEFELAVLDAPQTSRSFVALARKGFFNGLQVHRVVPNFVVQDGDPRGDGEGGPGYTIRDELNERQYVRGTVGMALAWKDTGGSQFFITHSPQPHLDGRYTAIGHVISGMDVVDRIQVGDVIQRIRVWDGKGWE